MIEIKSFTSKKLSHYQTLHNFEAYGDLNNINDFLECCQWAKKNKVKIYILGNGSNTLFTKKNIKTLILKNNLLKTIEPISNNRLKVSSSVQIIDILKYCYQNSWNSFYYLASVPATIGGALAMNAGGSRRQNCSVYDFVESVTFFEEGEIKTLKTEAIIREYRQTIFTGLSNKFILSTVLKFEPTNITKNPIKERMTWSKLYQDYTAPNCGSVFKIAYMPILRILQGLSIGKTSFSPKTCNWISNKSSSSIFIIILIKFAIILHHITGKKIALELIEVD